MFSITLLIVEKDVLVVFEKRLHSVSLCLHVSQLPVDVRRTHNRRGENNGEIERCHLDDC